MISNKNASVRTSLVNLYLRQVNKKLMTNKRLTNDYFNITTNRFNTTISS